jgi:hypothetical protein
LRRPAECAILPLFAPNLTIRRTDHRAGGRNDAGGRKVFLPECGLSRTSSNEEAGYDD